MRRGLARDGSVIDLGRHYPNTRRHWCSKRTELLYEIQRKRKAIGALTRRGQVDEVARLTQQMGPLFVRARDVGIEPYAEATKPRKPNCRRPAVAACQPTVMREPGEETA